MDKSLSDKKQFTIVMLVSASFVLWILYGSFEVVSLNSRLEKDTLLSEYPYHFRVIKQDDGVAVMGTLHTNYLTLREALRVMFPELTGIADKNWRMRQAEKEYARMQARAQSIVMAQGDFERVRWELDETWLRLLKVERLQTLQAAAEGSASAL
ncbi:MAG: hypothetical protein IPM37_02610 [Hahellaceae bacterium]|nr:hypothetical protein [Hahellaceae bacterium]